MAMLTKDQIIQARTAGIKRVHIEALGGDVLIRMMSMSEQLQLSDAFSGLKEDEIAAIYASYLLSNEDGSRMYSTPEDVALLGSELTMEALTEITGVGQSVNVTSSEEVEATAKK